MNVMLSLILCLILSGCAAFTQLVATSAPPPSSASETLQFYNDAKALTPTALRQLYAQEQARLTQADAPAGPIRLALLLTIQGTPFHDNGRAAELLRAYTQQTHHDADLRALASLLLSTLSEAQRQVTRYQKTKLALDGVIKEKTQIEHRYEWTKNRLAHAQNERSQHEKHYEQVNEALRQEKQTVENLREQIEQLKTIEKMLNERKVKKTPAT